MGQDLPGKATREEIESAANLSWVLKAYFDVRSQKMSLGSVQTKESQSLDLLGPRLVP